MQILAFQVLLALSITTPAYLQWYHNNNNNNNHNNNNNNGACVTPLGSAGLCVSLQYCNEVLTLFTRLSQQKATEYSVVLQNLCGRRVTPDNYPVVCCTRSSIHAVTPIRTTTTADTLPTTMTTTTTTSTPSPPPVSERSSNTRNCSQLRHTGNDPTQPDWVNGIDVRLLDDNCEEESTPTPPTTAPLRPRQFISEKEGCGAVQQYIPRVVGGEDSRIGAWPWLVLLGYDAHSLSPFKCGGTLVTARHVVTAAHCILPELSFVRLGEFDLSQENETDYVDINIDKSVKHPEFREYKNDIAVILLEQNVQFSDLISPICMPTSTYMRTKSFVDYNPFVAGWGRTMEGGRASVVLQQLQIPILENTVCRNAYLARRVRESAHAFDERIVCAGHLAGGKDTCQGDSGGPLMIPEPFKGITRYYLLGVVSYGIGCGSAGIPGIYTSTQHYIDWIAQQIAEM